MWMTNQLISDVELIDEPVDVDDEPVNEWSYGKMVAGEATARSSTSKTIDVCLIKALICWHSSA